MLHNSANRATTFWIIARFAGAVGFFTAQFMPEKGRKKIKKSLLVIIVISFCAGVFAIATYYPELFPPMYIEGEGLTDIKIILEYIIIAFLAVAAVIHLSNNSRSREDKYDILFPAALLISIFSELAFVRYNSV